MNRIREFAGRTVKLLSLLWKHHRPLVIGVIAVLVAVTVLIVCLAGSGGEQSSEASCDAADYSEGYPEFDGELIKKELLDSSTVYYYSDVHREDVDAYAKLLEQECGASFGSSGYPTSIVCEDVVITLHYNASELEFSVTFTHSN